MSYQSIPGIAKYRILDTSSYLWHIYIYIYWYIYTTYRACSFCPPSPGIPVFLVLSADTVRGLSHVPGIVCRNRIDYALCMPISPRLSKIVRYPTPPVGKCCTAHISYSSTRCFTPSEIRSRVDDLNHSKTKWFVLKTGLQS